MARKSRLADGNQDPTQGADEKIIHERIKKKGGEVIIRNWIKGRFLGKGGFAKWYEFTNCDNKKIYAAKVILKSSLTK